MRASGAHAAVMLPSTDGVISTQDGAKVLFQFQWRAVFASAKGGSTSSEMAALTRVFECVHGY